MADAEQPSQLTPKSSEQQLQPSSKAEVEATEVDKEKIPTSAETDESKKDQGDGVQSLPIDADVPVAMETGGGGEDGAGDDDKKEGEEEDDDDESSDDIAMLLVEDDSESSDEEVEKVQESVAPSADVEKSSSRAEFEANEDPCKSSVKKEEESSNDDTESEAEESDIKYKVKITRFGGGDFEGFEITHEPVSKIFGVKDAVPSDTDSDSSDDGHVAEKGESKNVQTKDSISGGNEQKASLRGLKDEPSDGKFTATCETDSKTAIAHTDSSNEAKPSTSKMGRSMKAATSNVDRREMGIKLPSSPTSSRSSIRLPSSPISSSSDFKPSTPGTLSSRSSTTGSYDEGSRVGDSGSSSVLRAMRNSTRVRRESREQREKQEKLFMSEKSREESRTKSHVDRRRVSSGHDDKPSPPKTRGRMVRPGFEFVPGFKIEAMDFSNKWYQAKIVQIEEEKNKIQIHFEGWNSRYDEWVHFNSPKLRPLVRTSNRKDVIKETPVGSYKAGDEVHARWSDGRYYPGKIVGINESGSYRIVFYDGIEKNVQGNNVREAPVIEKEYKVGDEVLARWSDCRYYPGKIVGTNASGSYRIIFYDGIEKNVQGINVREMPEQLKQQDFFSNLQAQIERAEKNASQRQKNRELRLEKQAASASSSSAPNAPEERKRRLSSPTPSPTGRVKRSRSIDEVARSKVSSKEGRRSRNSTEETKLPIKDEGNKEGGGSGLEVKVQSARRGQGVVRSAGSRKGHFLMGGKKREERSSIKLVKPQLPVPKPMPKPVTKPAASPSLTAKELRSTSITSQGKIPSTPPAQPTRTRPGHAIVPVVEHISMDERLEVAKNLEKLRAIASKEPLFATTQIGHLKDPTKFIAPKELIIDLDHNKFKCDVPGCSKAFRKASLLDSHMKYYHTDASEASPGPVQEKEKATVSRPRKRNASATMTTAPKVRRDSGNSSSPARSPSPSSPPAKLAAKRSSAPSSLSIAPPAPIKKPEPPTMKSPRSPPSVKSPKSPLGQLVKSPKSPPPPSPPITKSPKSPTPTSPSASTKELKSLKEAKPLKEVKSPKEMKSSKDFASSKPPTIVKAEKKDKEERGAKEGLDSPGVKAKQESKSVKSSGVKGSVEEEKAFPGTGPEVVKSDAGLKPSPSSVTSEVKKAEKTSPSSATIKSAASITPSIVPVKRDENSKVESGRAVKREGLPKAEKMKHKKHKDKHKKHKDKKKKKKKKKEKEKKKKKKKRQKDGGKTGVARGQEKYKDIDEYILEKKKKEFKFEMPVPVSEFRSEYSRHPAPILKSQLLRSMERGEVERGAGEGDMVRCICYRKTEEGFMIQCERCLCWQHSSCVGLTKSTVPEHYVCLICFNPRDQRVSAKYRYSQKWVNDGNLASFSSAPKEHVKEASHNLAATNRLIGEMHVINEVLRSLKQKLHTLQTPDHPDMKLWARSLLKPKTPEKKPDPIKIPPLDAGLSSPLGSGLPLSIDGALEPEASLTPQETEQIARIMAMSGDPMLATLVNLALPCEVGLDSSASSMIDGSLLKEDQNLADVDVGGIPANIEGQGEVVPMDTGGGMEGVVGGVEIGNDASGVKVGSDASLLGNDRKGESSGDLQPGDGEHQVVARQPEAGTGNSDAGISKGPTMQRQGSEGEDFEPPTVKFVMSSSSGLTPTKEGSIVDISDIPSTSAGPSQEQLEAAGMMRIQPLTHGGRRVSSSDESSQDSDTTIDIEDNTSVVPDQPSGSHVRDVGTSKQGDDTNVDIAPDPDTMKSQQSMSDLNVTSVDSKVIEMDEDKDKPVPSTPVVAGVLPALSGPTELKATASHVSITDAASSVALAPTNTEDSGKDTASDSVHAVIASSKGGQTGNQESKHESAGADEASGDVVTDGLKPTPDTTEVVKEAEDATSSSTVTSADRSKDEKTVSAPDVQMPQTTQPSENSSGLQQAAATLETATKRRADEAPSVSGTQIHVGGRIESGVASLDAANEAPGLSLLMDAMQTSRTTDALPSAPTGSPRQVPSVNEPITGQAEVTQSDGKVCDPSSAAAETPPTATPVNMGGETIPPAAPAATPTGPILPPPTGSVGAIAPIGPGGDAGNKPTPPTDVPGPSGFSAGGDLSVSKRDQPSTSGYTSRPVATGVTLSGSSVWTPVKDASKTASLSKKEGKHSKKDSSRVKSSRRVVEVPLSLCRKNLREHIEFLEAELEKRMDIIEEEANALEQQFAELPGLSPDIRGLATMNDSFLKTKLQTLLGDLENISNIVAL